MACCQTVLSPDATDCASAPRAAQASGPNEVWSFGAEAFEHIRQTLFLRERLRPYLLEQMQIAHVGGLPPMRPLFVDFPADPMSWASEDSFMFGPSILVAPVTEYRARERAVYLPAGSRWTNAWTGQEHPGGTLLTAAAPLNQIPVFLRDGADLQIAAPAAAR